ncbi:ABC transporter permease subunit [Actinomadura soli]|uniref:ABC transporter permease subunit n=1 Tax=Actinomadura soli TaxID=2508997 RepID=UPI00197AF78D|nr:ATP-binding cassette domain-containing protein [Actinomadura soli]
MNAADLLPFIVSGIVVGTVYGLAAGGLVLTYKTSGIFNFGHGALATAAAYAFYSLHVVHGVAWPVALILSVLVLGPGLGLLMERFAAKLAPQPTTFKIVGTIGLVLVVQGVAVLTYGTTTIRVKQFLPGAGRSFAVLGVVVSYDKAMIAAVALASVAALWAFFRRSRTGLAMRAVVDDPALLAMRGTDAVRVRRAAWIIGSTFAALSGVLIAPLIGLDSILLTFMVVQAFAAAVIGRFSNIPLTLVGGIVVGIAASVAEKYALGTSWLSGLPASVPFLILFVVLLIRGRTLVSPRVRTHVRPSSPYRAPGWVRAIAGAVVLVPLLVVPELVGDRLSFFTTGLATALMLLSLGLLVRTSGQVSLCHSVFAAIGAVAFSQLHLDLGLPWLVAVLLGALVAVPIGALVAIPAIRLSGLFLALATFGFGILVQQLLYPQTWMFTSFAQGREMPHPSFAEEPEQFYYVVLAALFLTALTVVLIERSRLGRMLRGMAGSPEGVSAMGLSTSVTRVTVFCVSAFLAAIAGILLGVERNFATGGDAFFGSYNSLILLAMLALAPFAEPWYALLPAIGAVVPGYFTGADTTSWLNIIFGVSAVLVSMAGGNPTMPTRWRARLDRLAWRRGGSSRPAPAALPRVREEGDRAAGLEVRELTVRYGGLMAVHGLSLDAPMGKITGLIGPNGAGKTSTFDVCSGFNRRHGGRVLLHGSDVTGRSAAARARNGLGRTFQSVELCDTLTVLENVRLGHEAGQAGANPLAQIVAGPVAWRTSRQRAAAALERCGLTHLAGTPAGELSTGQRRLAELARCLAGGFDVLLLDEPSAGLDPDETARFGDLVLSVVQETGVGVLLIEHDMALVMRLCGYLYVLDFGELIFEGTPAAVAASPVVQAAYLGSDVAVERVDENTRRS